MDYTIIIRLSLLLLAGAMDATAEALKFHPSGFFKRFPNANPNFWLIGDSWDNKWKNEDPAQGERFWQSSRALVFLTDGYHLARMIRNVCMLVAVLLPLSLPFTWYYPIAYLLLYLAYTGGFSIVFDKLFKT